MCHTTIYLLLAVICTTTIMYSVVINTIHVHLNIAEVEEDQRSAAYGCFHASVRRPG